MKARRSTSSTRSSFFAALGDLPRRHRRAGGFVAVLASMALVVSMTSAAAYADDTAGTQPAAPASQAASSDDTATPEQTPASEQGGDNAEKTDTGEEGGDTSPAPSESPSPSTDESEKTDETDASSDEPTEQPTWTATPLNGLGGLATGQATTNPGSSQTSIVVKVRGDRTGGGDNAVAPLAGVTLQLYTSSNLNTKVVKASGDPTDWTTCTSDADGDCQFLVPRTNSTSGGNTGANGNQGLQFYVAQTGVPANWFQNDNLRTGSFSGAGNARRYTFRTPQMTAGSTFTSNGSNGFMSTSSGETRSSGFWQSSRSNPPMTQKCGLKVALIVDLSASISSSDLTKMKTATDSFVQSLVGTPSSVAMFTFGYDSPANSSTSPNHSTLTPVTTQAQADTVKAWNNNWDNPGATNWDAGLLAAAQANTAPTGNNHFDVAVMLTDGNPNYFNSPQSGSTTGYFESIERGIFSANALKANGTRVLAVGVGDGASGNNAALNLSAISGKTAFNNSSSNPNYLAADYYQSSDYTKAGQALEELANGNCAGKLNITKMVVDADSTVNDLKNPTPTSGWEFGAVKSTTAPNDITVTGSPKTTGTDGGASFDLNIPGGVTNGNIDVTENPTSAQAGYSLLKVECSVGASPANPTVNNNKFTVNVKKGQANNCVVYNKKPDPKGDLIIQKKDAFTGELVTVAGAKFEIKQGTSAAKTVIDNNTGSADLTDADPAIGKIKVEGLSLTPTASYTVTEVAAPSGYLLPPTGDRSQSVTITSGNAVTVTFNDHKPWSDLKIDKTVVAKYDSSYAWSITKKVKDAQGNWVDQVSKSVAASGATGQGSFDYKVEVTQGAQTRSNYRLSGVVTVTNDNVGRTMRATLSDAPNVGSCSFPGVTDVDPNTPGLQVDVAPGANTYNYTCTVTGTPTSGQNVATVTWSKATYPKDQGDVNATNPGIGTASVTKNFTFAEDASTNKTVTLSDTKFTGTPTSGPALPATLTWSAPGTKTEVLYTRTLTVNAGTCTDWDQNVAQIKNGQGTVLGSDNAKVKLCAGADLTVAKTASGSFDRTYLWNITKVACDTEDSAVVDACQLSEALTTPQFGSPANPGYTVRVTPGQPLTTGYQMTGKITVANPNDWDVTLTDIQDDYLGSTGETCTITTAERTVPANGSKDFGYECTFAQATPPTLDGVNKATVTWDKDTAHTPSGTATGQHTLDPNTEWTETATNKTVHVYDVLTGGTPSYLGSVTWTSGLGATYFHPEHKNLTAPVGECKSYTDTAWLAGSKNPEADPLGSDDAKVKVCSSHYTLDKSVSPSGTVKPGDTLTYTLKVHNDSQATVHGFTVTDNLADVLDDATLVTPLDADLGISGNTLTWTHAGDVAPDGDVTISYQVKVKAGAWNKTLHNVATPGQGGDCVAQGECETTTVTPHYTLSKTSNKGQTVQPGDTITYTLKVHNDSQGTLPGFTVTDNLADVLDDATLVTPLAADLEVDGNTLTWTHAGDVAPDGDVTISYQVKVNADAWKATIKNAVTPGDGGDCVPGECTTTSKTPHYLLSKTSNKGQTVQPGDTITYTLKVHNDSETVLPGFSVTDNLADVLDDATLVTPLDADLGISGNTLTWTHAGDVAPDGDVTISYQVKVNADAWKATIKNAVTPGKGGDCVPGECTTTSNTPHYVLSKSSSPATGSTVMPGDTITYTLKVHNDSQATLPGFTIKDNLANVLDDATLVTPLAADLEVDGNTLTWTHAGDVAPDGDVTISYQVKVKADAWKATIKNAVTPGKGGDCVPGECTTTSNTPHYVLSKSASPSGTVAPGDVVTYTLKVHNDSQATLPGFSVTDNLANVLDDATLVTPLAADLEVDGNTLTWTHAGDVAPDADVTISYQVKVNDGAWKATLTNVVTPGDGGDCVPGECTTTSGTPHYLLSKTSNKGQTVQPGDTITYTLKVHNDSETVLPGFSVTDNLANVLDDATLVTPLAADLEVDGNTLTWTHAGDVAPDGDVTISYQVKVNADAWKATLTNVVTPGKGGECVPGECTTTSKTPHYLLSKTSNKGQTVQPGDTITYTLKVHNDSQATLPGFTIKDDLTDVLDDATVVTPLDADLGISGNTLTWTHAGDVAPDADVTISYQVKVNADAWKATIKNAVTPGKGGDCVPGECTTTSNTPHYVLSKSSSPATGSTVMPGDVVTYTLKVHNDSQGTVPGFTIKDNLANVLDDATLVEPLAAGLSVSGNTLTWTHAGDVAPDGDVTISYQVKVNADAWKATLTNVVTPGDGGDCVPGECTTTSNTPHYVLSKSSSPATGSTVMPGDTITYTLKVHNDSQGTVPGFTIKDDLTDVLDDATVVEPLDADLEVDGNTLTWTHAGDVAPDADVTISYQVKVNDDAWKATIKNAVTPGDGGDCEPGECTTTNVTPHYTLAKSVETPSGTSTVKPGDTLTYKLTVTNDSGNGAVLDAFSVKDDLTDVLGNTTGDPEDVTASVGTHSFTSPELAWSSDDADLADGATATLTYKVTVKDGAWNQTLTNVATPGDGGECVEGECTTTNKSPRYALEKSSDKDGKTVQPGTVVTYQLKVTNTSDNGALLPAFEVVDNMAAVVNSTSAPVITAPGAGQTASYSAAARAITWAGAGLSLEPGESVTLTYKVTINANAWNRTIHNVATPKPGTGGECVAAGSCDTTSHTPPQVSPPVVKPPTPKPPKVKPPKTLPNTGGPASGWMYAGGALLVLGGGLVLLDRRRRRHNR